MFLGPQQDTWELQALPGGNLCLPGPDWAGFQLVSLRAITLQSAKVTQCVGWGERSMAVEMGGEVVQARAETRHGSPQDTAVLAEGISRVHQGPSIPPEAGVSSLRREPVSSCQQPPCPPQPYPKLTHQGHRVEWQD